jgi:hypothetical protein
MGFVLSLGRIPTLIAAMVVHRVDRVNHRTTPVTRARKSDKPVKTKGLQLDVPFQQGLKLLRVVDGCRVDFLQLPRPIH